VPIPGRDHNLRIVAMVLWRFALPAIAISAAILGFVGLRQHLAVTHPDYPNDVWDLAYYDLQLFVIGSPPLDNGGAFPLSLQVARFAAPAVTVYALIEAARLLFAAEFVRIRARHARGHDVVCGNSLVAQALCARLFDERRRVVWIHDSGEPVPHRRGLLFVSGDPSQPDVLRLGGLHRASTLYVCADEADQNLAVVLAAAQIRRGRRPPLCVHVQVDDPEFCLALQARRLGLGPSDRLQVNFFNWHELAARTLVADQPPAIFPDRPTRAVIVGGSWFGAAVAVELARYWRLQRGDPAALQVAVVDEQAAAFVVRLRRRYPFVESACDFTSYTRRVETLLDGDLPLEPPDQTFLCCEDEQVALKLALTMDHFWRRGPRSVKVRLNRLGDLERAFHPREPGQLLDAVSGAIYFFDALRAGCDPRLVDDSLVERLARAIHEDYLRRRMADGATPGDSPAIWDWARLPDPLKDANRAQAVDVGRKLRSIGCALAPNPSWGPPGGLDGEVIERLAEQEHGRWCAERYGTGWSYGAVRDDRERRHPDLVEWGLLRGSSQDKNRDAVRALPGILAEAGFQIVRLDGHPSRAAHFAC
jgi:voltage-gated potassium channel Kch